MLEALYRLFVNLFLCTSERKYVLFRLSTSKGAYQRA